MASRNARAYSRRLRMAWLEAGVRGVGKKIRPSAVGPSMKVENLQREPLVLGIEQGANRPVIVLRRSPAQFVLV
ncbi:hypothetical protein DFAR_200038 [Desulfarculales bacterium]